MKREELTVPLSELKPNPDNPRTIKKQKLNQLKKSLAEFPEMMQLRPIVVDENNVILGGNMRYEALKANGAVEAASDKKTADLGKYRRPRNVKVASDFAKANRAGCENVFTFDQVCLVKNIDAMRAKGKALYGAGCIVSDAVADKLDRDAAEAERHRAARMGEQPGGLCLELSAREKAIVAELNKGGK